MAGPVPDAPGLWVASGCNGSGFSSSLALGEALAAWICDAPGRLDISALAPARFGALTDEALIARAPGSTPTTTTPPPDCPPDGPP